MKKTVSLSQDFAIRVIDLVKTYGKGDAMTQALRGVSFDVKQGDFLMITGRNGSGKSTFMHQVALLDMPDSGQILMNIKDKIIDSTKLNESARRHLRLREIGYIFQEYALIQELTALENVMLPCMMLGSSHKARQKASRLLERVNLGQKVHRLPAQLSGGEQQRVAIARSLINDPHIIFADEPTANLDSVASAEVLDIFKKINKEDQVTIIMITHEPEELEYANHHIIFSDGNIKV